MGQMSANVAHTNRLKPFDSIALTTMSLGLWSSFAAILFLSEPLRGGAWFLHENALLSLHLSSGLCLAGAALLFGRRQRLRRQAWRFLPLPLCFAFMGLWPGMGVVFDSDRAAYWLGDHFRGEGPLYYLDWSILVFSALILRRIKGVDSGLLWALAAGALISHLMSFRFAADMGHQVTVKAMGAVGLLSLIVAASVPDAQHRILRRALGVIGLLLALYSKSLVLIAVALVVLPVLLVVTHLLMRRRSPVAPAFALMALLSLVIGLGVATSECDGPCLVASYEAMDQSPSGSSLFGAGWDRVDDLAQRLGGRPPGDVFEAFSRQNDWEESAFPFSLARSRWEQTLFAGGLPTLLMSLFIPSLIVLSARRGKLPHAMVVGVTLGVAPLVYPPPPLLAPFTAAAIALVVRPLRFSERRMEVMVKAGGVPLLLVIAIPWLMGTGVAASRYETTVMSPVCRQVPAAMLENTLYPKAMLKGRFFSEYEAMVEASKTKDQLSNEDWNRRLIMWCLADAVSNDHDDYLLALVSVNLQGFMEERAASRPAWAAPLFQSMQRQWEGQLRSVLDMTGPQHQEKIAYFIWRFNNRQFDAILSLADELLEANPDDPVALYFSSMVLAQDQKEMPEAKKRLKKALQNHFETLYPVDSKTYFAIMQM